MLSPGSLPRESVTLGVVWEHQTHFKQGQNSTQLKRPSENLMFTMLISSHEEKVGFYSIKLPNKVMERVKKAS